MTKRYSRKQVTPRSNGLRTKAPSYVGRSIVHRDWDLFQVGTEMVVYVNDGNYPCFDGVITKLNSKNGNFVVQNIKDEQDYYTGSVFTTRIMFNSAAWVENNIPQIYVNP